MRKQLKRKWKKACASAMAFVMAASMCPVTGLAEEAGQEPAGTQTKTVELIKNGNFDAGTEGWSALPDPWVSNTNLEVTTEQNSCLKLTNRNKPTDVAAYTFPAGTIKPETEYHLKASIKYVGSEDSVNFDLIAQNGEDSKKARQAIKYGIVYQLKNNQWTSIDETFTLKAKADGDNGETWSDSEVTKIFFQNPYDSENNGDYYLDDVSITDTEGNELISNGNFNTNTEGWSALPDPWVSNTNLEVTTEQNSCLKLTNRNKPTDVAAYTFPAGAVKPGIEYHLKASVKYVGSEDSVNFDLIAQNGEDSKGPRQAIKYGIIYQLKNNQWKSINETFTLKAKADGDNGETWSDSEVTKIFFQNPYDSENNGDYYLDDVSLTYEKEVTEAIIESVVITPTTANVKTGGQFQFSAEVTGQNDPPQDVSWSVSGNDSSNTSINTDGILSVASNETAKTLTVTATSVIDDSKKAEVTVTVEKDSSTDPGTEPEQGQGGCLKIAGRSGKEDGPMQDLSGKVKKGTTYMVSAKVKYVKGTVDNETFNLTIQNGKDYNYRQVLGKITASKGEWAQIKAEYTPGDYIVKDGKEDTELPFSETNNLLFIETAGDGEKVDFYVDDVSMKYEKNGTTEDLIANGTFDNNDIDKWKHFSNAWPPAESTLSWVQDGQIEITSDIKNVTKGKTHQFSAEVISGNDSAQNVKWSVTGSNNNNTSITDNGLLTVALDETAKTLTVIATSATDTSKKAEVTVTVKEESSSDPGQEQGGCLKIADRNPEGGNQDGPMQNLTGKIEKGKTYHVCAKIKYIRGQDKKTFNILMQNGSGWQYRQTIGSVTAEKGKWATLEVDYTPSDIISNGETFAFSNEKNLFFIETDAWGKNKDTDYADFYIDDVSITYEENGETKELITNGSFDENIDGWERFSDAWPAAQSKLSWVQDGEDEKNLIDAVELFVNGDVELKEQNWLITPGSNGKIAASSDEKANGVYSIRAYERKTTDAGPCQDVSGKLEKGKEYIICGMIKYLTGPAEKTFNITVQNGADYSYRQTAGTVTAKKGKWKWFSISYTPGDTDATHPFSTEKNYVFIETPFNANPTADDLMDIYLDDFSMMLDDGNKRPAVQEHECIDGASLVSGALKNAETTLAKGNPLRDYKFGADPYAITYNGRVYVYMTNDSQELGYFNSYGYPTQDNGFGKITTISVISSADMVNWTDHGDIPVIDLIKPDASGKKWASNSWAPAVAYKQIDGKDKFFMYFANGGGGIGVLEGDSPVGPFREPATGSKLIFWGDQGAEGVAWLFDPAVLVDDDGTGYLYYGGGIPGDSNATQEQKNHPKTGRVIKLKDNMVQVDGNAEVIDAPGLFEDSGIHKYKDKYYYTYCSNFNNNLKETGNGNICYMVSDNPMTGFEFGGIAFKNQANYFGNGSSGNNHHCFFEFNGKNYLTYHTQTLASDGLKFKTTGGQGGYRSTHINEFTYGTDGKINDIIGTWEGSAQVKDFDPYERTEAETIAWSKGINTAVCSEPGTITETVNMKLTEITDGDYTALSNVAFGDGAKSFTIHASSLAGGTIELHLDTLDGEKVGEVTIPAGDAAWKDYSCNVIASDTKGTHDLYLVFKNSSTVAKLMELDYWKFGKDFVADSITITPDKATVKQGATQQFKVVFSGNSNMAQTVTWSVTGSTNKGTFIKDGLLTVATDETAKTLTVTATSTVDTTKKAEAKVTVEADAQATNPPSKNPGIQGPGIYNPGPGTQNPGTQDPDTQNPGTQDPGTQDPGTQNPGTQDPGTQNPGTQDPGTQNPGTQDPGTQNPPKDNNTTTETKPDGTTVETTTQTKPDGTKTETTKETQPDGTVIQSITETKKDGSVTEKKEVTAADKSATLKTTVQTDANKQTIANAVIQTGTIKENGTIDIPKELLQNAADTKNIDSLVVAITDTTVKSASSTKKETVINVNIPAVKGIEVEKVILTKESISTAKSTGKGLVITITDNNSANSSSDSYKVTIPAKQLAKIDASVKELNVTINAERVENVADTSKKDSIAKIIDKTKGNTNKTCVVSVASNKNVTAGMKVTVPVTDKTVISKGSKVYVYKYNPATGKLIETANCKQTVSANGSVVISAFSGTDYVVSAKKLSGNKVETIKDGISVSVPKKTVKTGKTMKVKTSLPDTVSTKTKFGTEKAVITYKCNKSKVASVSKNGKIKAKKKGTVTITTTIKLSSGQKVVKKQKVTIK